jgi:hypothetical protein
MQATCDVTKSTHQTLYLVADQSIVVEAQDTWAANVIEKLFAGWYLTRAGLKSEGPAAIVIRSMARPPQIPLGWQQFEIAGGGVCCTDGRVSYIDIEGSVIVIDAPGHAAVETWLSGRLPIQSPALTRVVTYALAAGLRRRGLFELHSAAVVDPQTGKGVLIIGPSGSGKSSLTVQLSAAGWPFLTDDVLALSAQGTEVKAWPLRRCFAITPETFAASSFLQASASLDYLKAQRDDKTLFAPHNVFYSEFRENCVPSALFFSQIGTGERSQISVLSAGETMVRLIRMNPWSCYDQTTAANHLAVLSALVKQSRGYALIAGKDLLDPNISARLIASYTRD